MSATGAPRNRSKYQGKPLFFLVLALCLPAGFLYLRLVLGLAAGESRVTARESMLLNRWSLVFLVLFFVAEVISARYLQRLMPPARTRVGQAFSYLLTLTIGILFSLTGAIVLEAFGLNVFLRVAGHR